MVTAGGGSESGGSRGKIGWVIPISVNASLPPIFHWIELSHMAQPNCNRYGRMSLPVCTTGKLNDFVEHGTQVVVVVLFYWLAPVKISTLNITVSF